jgi:hypothetical protein
MNGTEPAIVDLLKESNDIGSDTMIVEETENSSSFTQSKEAIAIFSLYVFPYGILKFCFNKCCNLHVMDNVEMVLVDVPKEATSLGLSRCCWKGQRQRRCIEEQLVHDTINQRKQTLILF